MEYRPNFFNLEKSNFERKTNEFIFFEDNRIGVIR